MSALVPLRAGCIGLGNIGQPMARRLVASGLETTVFDAVPGAGDELVAVGARRAASARAVATATDVVGVCVRDDADVQIEHEREGAPMPTYPRQELEKMVALWLETNARAERTGNWRPLADLYTEDAYYCWDIPGGLYEARGRENIRVTCVGEAMDPYAGWTYPYDKIVIDEHKGECFGSWWQTPPGAPVRPDGSKMRIIGASWFRYGGDYRWCEQRDFYDFGRTMEFIDECADRGILSDLARQRRTERNKRLIQMLEHRLAYLRKSIEE